MDVDEDAPTELNAAALGHAVTVDQDKLTIRYTGDARHNHDVGAVQSNRPVPKQRLVFYYEVLIHNEGARAKIAIGFADKHFKLTRQPGWEPGSYGYHGDDGKKFHQTGAGEDYGPRFGTGDVIGAGIHLGKGEMFFTKNGVKLKTAFRNVRAGLYPTIGLHSKHECVEVNFGAKPFRFDLQGLINEERAAQQAAIDALPVPLHAPLALVEDYLRHAAYARTLGALRREAGHSLGLGSVLGAPAPQQEATAPAAQAATAAASFSAQGPPQQQLQQQSEERGRGARGAGRRRRRDQRANELVNDSAQHQAESVAMSIQDEEQPPQEEEEEEEEGHGGQEEVLREDTTWLALRARVRLAVLAGEMEAAMAALKHACPQVLAEGQGYDTLRLQLHCQSFIELVRSQQVPAALAWAHAALAPLRYCLPLPHVEATLKEVVALLAYDHPQESPLAHLLSQTQRHAVADATNLALLNAAAGRPPDTSPPPQAALARVLQQLVATHDVMLDVNGGQGEPFDLPRVLGPAARAPPRAV